MLFPLLCVLFFMAQQTISLQQLAFSGGGSFGAVEIGILKHLIEVGLEPIDLYTGISAGALNAGFLSYYSDIRVGAEVATNIYGSICNHDIYKLLPTTGISILNTAPLNHTLTEIINKMPNKPVVHTLIGTVNLYSGNLDIFEYESAADPVAVLMASSAIPGAFPPISYLGAQYADGGTLSNELLQVEHRGVDDYLNITYITPYQGYIEDKTPITNLREMMGRTAAIVMANYNDPLTTMNQECFGTPSGFATPSGEINKYFVRGEHLEGYNILNFDSGAELVEIGRKYVEHEKYWIC